MLYCAASGYVALWRGSPGAVPLADSRPHPAGLRSSPGRRFTAMHTVAQNCRMPVGPSMGSCASERCPSRCR